MKQTQDQIAQWLGDRYAALGADGFGFSGTRAAARRYFHIDGPSMAVKALQKLAEAGEKDAGVVQEAIDKYRLLDVSSAGNAGGDA